MSYKKITGVCMQQKIDLVNVRLPSEIIHWLDKLVSKGIYNSRSEAIRHFIRAYVLEKRNA
jgi:Arc/MetJ-type ribon-helix-helix transcriptional regulator